MKIKLYDNNIEGNDSIFLRKEISSLFSISNKSITDLCKQNENLLIFPNYIEQSNDKIGSNNILKIINTNDSEKVYVSTGNIMGFIGINNLQLKIKSRFDKNREDYLLHYMLQKVMSFNLFDLSHNNEKEDVFDFLMFMFPYYLKLALRQGIYREYQYFHYNNSKIRGNININNHIKKNVPFIGNISYSTREYSYDNNMTQLIRHTIEFIKTQRYGNIILNFDNETMNSIRSIFENTKSFNIKNRGIIINNNLRHKSHPYYTEYNQLQNLCLQILRMEEIKYGEHNNDVYGILFDGAWLWEEYINTILCNYGFKHPQNKIHSNGIYLFEDIDDNGNKRISGIRFPDFYKDNMVLDAKYKRIGRYNKVSSVGRNDIHQLIAYMINLNATKGGFIAPLKAKQTKVPTSQLKDKQDTISIFGIEIDKTKKSYPEFCKNMKQAENNFINSLKI